MVGLVEAAITNAEAGKSKLTPEILALRGMSSAKVRHFLNNLVQYNTKYLEVGVWKGSTLISALYKNEYAIATAIDNFTQFDGRVEELMENVAHFKLGSLNVVTEDFRSFNPQSSHLYNTYFYDGPHKEQDQYDALIHMDKYLDSPAIIIIDDYNQAEAKHGTSRALEELKYNIVKDWTLPARFNGDKEQWWNGLYVMVIEKYA